MLHMLTMYVYIYKRLYPYPLNLKSILYVPCMYWVPSLHKGRNGLQKQNKNL